MSADALQFLVSAQQVEEVSLALAEYDVLGIVETGTPEHVALTVYFSSTEHLIACQQALARYQPAVVAVNLTHDPLAYQQQWQSLALGTRWFLAPAWDACPTPPGRIRLLMQRGAVFGSGDHVTTQLALLLLEETLRLGDCVLDIGTGTGILAIAAALLGAQPVLACDLDPEALQSARQASLQANAPVLLWQGSFDSCSDRVCTLLLANLPGGLLLDLLPDLARVVAPHGRMVLTGILEEQANAFEAACVSAGLVVFQKKAQAGWLAYGVYASG